LGVAQFFCGRLRLATKRRQVGLQIGEYTMTRKSDKRAPLVLLGIALLITQLAHAQSAMELPLYEGAIRGAIDSPNAERLRDANDAAPFLLDVSRPTITAYALSDASAATPAVLIFPGGSYRGVSIEKEGHAAARAFNQMGVAAFVVKYRSPNDTHMTNRSLAPLQDAQQAIQMVRQRARDWNVDPQRVGVVGFSAGGHLAATAAFQFDQPVLPSDSGVSLRPDFVVLLYPVVSMSDELTHALSRQNLLGVASSKELVAQYSMELHVPTNAPPMFLMHAADDKAVKVENTLQLFAALRANNVAAEMHIYPRGGHGFGLVNATTNDQWIERCKNWLMSQGILTEAK